MHAPATECFYRSVVVSVLANLCVLTSVQDARAQFATIINVPPDPAPQSIGSNTQLNLLAGGTVGDFFSAGAFGMASTNIAVNISGGRMGDFFSANAGSRVVLSSGTVGDGFNAFNGSQATIVGGEFRLNGELIEGLSRIGDTVPLDVPGRALFTGVLTDGTPFAFSSLDSDAFAPGTLNLRSGLVRPVGPSLITASTDTVPLGIREGQTLVVDDGGVVPDHFNAGMGAAVHVQEGGVVGNNLEAVRAQVIVAGGSVGGAMDAFESQVVLSGGVIEGGLEAFSGSQVAVSGGLIEGRLQAYEDSQLIITGGSIEGGLDAFEGSRVHLSGTRFLLDGVELSAAIPGEPVTIDERDVELTGTLADGSPFRLDLTSRFSLPQDFFSPEAMLTATLIPLLRGDYDASGTVEQADLDLVLLNWGNSLVNPSDAGWINDPPSGPIDQEELDTVLLNWGTTAPMAAAVPEPATIFVLVACVLLTRCRPRHA